MDIYRTGTGHDPEEVTVKQLQIGSGQVIPVGTWAMVAENTEAVGGTEYTMQVPVWL
jgi:hypothetical protein